MASHLSLLVTGSREDTIDPEPITEALDEFLELHTFDSLSLFVGCAKGADRIAREWWFARNPEHIEVKHDEPLLRIYESVPNDWNRDDWDDGFRERLFVFVANWYPDGKTLDRSAGPKRNARTVKAWAEDGGAHHAVAAWDGRIKNSGTLDCMSKVVDAGHDIRVVSVAKVKR